MTEAALLAVGGYIPRTRIARKAIAEMWHAPAVPGERAVAAADEDPVTMGTEAALSCLGTRAPSEVDALFFASTTAPYAEKQSASILAAALGLRPDVVTIDIGDSLRAATQALRSACDAVASGGARRVLVVAADRRVPQPESPMEQIFGDAAGAVLIGQGDGIARLGPFATVSDDVSQSWRTRSDPFVRSFSAKHEVAYGFVRPVLDAVSRLLEASSLRPQDVATLALPSPDGRAHLKAARAAGIGRARDPLVSEIGVLGAAAPFVALASALEDASAGDRVVVAAAGEGADAVLVEVSSGLPEGAWRPSVAARERSRVLGYGDYVRAVRSMDIPTPRIDSSPVTYWRDRRAQLSLHGMRCGTCGLVSYPPARVCRGCRAKDLSDEVALGRTGTVFTYTFDHIVAATYSTVPVIRAIVDLDGGGRVLTALSDCDTDAVEIGMPVRLVFRLMHEGGGFRNYFWKAVPAEGARA